MTTVLFVFLIRLCLGRADNNQVFSVSWAHPHGMNILAT